MAVPLTPAQKIVLAIAFAIEFHFLEKGFNPRKTVVPTDEEINKRLIAAKEIAVPSQIATVKKELMLTLKSPTRTPPENMSRVSYEFIHQSANRISRHRGPPGGAGYYNDLVVRLRGTFKPKKQEEAASRIPLLELHTLLHQIVHHPNTIHLDQPRLFALARILGGEGLTPAVQEILNGFQERERRKMFTFIRRAQPGIVLHGVQDYDTARADKQPLPGTRRKSRRGKR